MQSMFIAIAFILVLSFIISAVVRSTKTANLKNTYTQKLEAPPWADKSTKELFHKFNDAWTQNIEETVNIRAKQAFSNLSNRQLRERWNELKKFLFLAGISRKLPMFSNEIDELWHLFLKEKSLYNQFCLDFIGEEIEHHPHDQPKKMPAERAWFDIIYIGFFTISSHSHLWGPFFKEHAQHQQWIQKIRTESDELVDLFGKQTATPESLQTLRNFLHFAKSQLTDQAPKFAPERIQQIDGYWYGAALFSLTLYDSPEDLLKGKKDDHTLDNGGGGIYGGNIDEDKKKDWTELTEDVNTFESASGSSSEPTSGKSSQHGNSSNNDDGGASDSGSSCSSCSGCSS